MQSFEYYTPTKVIFGKDKENEIGKVVKGYGANRVFIVYGGGSVKKSGLLDRVEEALKKENIDFEEFGGVKPNPRLDYAREGVKKAIEFKADFILAVGGGSVIDTCKAIAHGSANPDFDIWDIWVKEKPLIKTNKFGVILTISAAGSEMSNSAVLTNEEIGMKQGLSTDLNRPLFAIMNPELTYTLPKYQLTNGIVDIYMHTLDRYFTHTKGNKMTDGIAEALMRNVLESGKIAFEDQTNYEAMSELMWCGSLSHNGLTGLGAETDFAPHRLGHSLSAKFDVSHGASISTVWGSWANYVYKEEPKRFVQYANNVFGIEGSDENTIKEGIESTVEFFKSINMPTCFSELGIGVQDEESLKDITKRCFYKPNTLVGKFLPLDEKKIYDIYVAANR